MSRIQVKALTSIMFLGKTLHPNIATLYKENIWVCSAIFFLLPNPAFQFQGLHSVDVYQKWMSRKLNLSNTSKIAIENKNQP